MTATVATELHRSGRRPSRRRGASEPSRDRGGTPIMRSFETKAHACRLRIPLLAAAILVALGATACTTMKNAATGTAEVVGDTSRKVVEAVTPGGGPRVRHTVAVI